MSDNPSDEQRWTPTNEELPGSGSSPVPEGIAGAGESQTQSDAPAQRQPGTYPPSRSGPDSSGKAVAALVCGILGLTICPVLIPSILAIVFGYSGRNEIDASGGQLGGRGLAIAGVILGWIGVALCILGILFLIVLIIIGAAVSDSDFLDITTTTDAILPLLR